MRQLILEDEIYMAEAIRDGLRLEASSADIAGDGDAGQQSFVKSKYEPRMGERLLKCAQRIRAS